MTEDQAEQARAAMERLRYAEGYAWSFRNPQIGPYQYGLIGGLVKGRWWRDSLPLAPTQASTITALDDLLRDNKIHTKSVAAEYLDTNPPDYEDFVNRINHRLNDLVPAHAERMVALGLLTDAQASFVMHHFLFDGKAIDQLFRLLHPNVHNLLNITADQTKTIQDWGEYLAHSDPRLAQPMGLGGQFGSTEQQELSRRLISRREQIDIDATNMLSTILTPEQRAKLENLTSVKTLPAEPPEMPAITDAEAANVKLNELSPVFRVLNEKADPPAISEVQKQFVKRLEAIIRQGLHWIKLRNTPTSQEYIRHAEQVALRGILTEKQAAGTPPP
jgi:hypothetical protein